jgi:hypothetical protein
LLQTKEKRNLGGGEEKERRKGEHNAGEKSDEYPSDGTKAS